MSISLFRATRRVIVGTMAGLIAGAPVTAQPQPPFSPAQLDQLSWQQFAAALRPSGVPGKVAYETWSSDQDIYVTNPCPTNAPTPGCHIPTWPSAASFKTAKPFQRSVLGAAHLGLARAGKGVEVIGPAQGCFSPPGLPPPSTNAAANAGFPAGGCVGEEVRRDRASFTYLFQAGLWSKKGLNAAFNTHRVVSLPWNAVDLKADWIPVTVMAAWIKQSPAFVTSHFYTANAQATKGGPVLAYALTSIHIAVKPAGFPDWVWTDFENAYTPGRCDQTGCTDHFGATKPSTPVNPTAWQQYAPCVRTAAATQLMNAAGAPAVFANYCLTGTQTRFVVNNQPTLLGSPVTEPLNANVPLKVSSCISCHAGASFNANGANPNNIGNPIGPHAPPPGYTPYDFMWGVLAAH